MKTEKLYLAVIVVGLVLFGCNRTDDSVTPTESLKTSLTTGVQDLTTAVNSISASAGYQAMAGTSSLKSGIVSPLDTTTNSILLADIAGVYDYKANTVTKGHNSILRFFTKTGESSQMIVRLPEEKVKAPIKLLRYSAADTLLVNNYQVNLSAYQYRFNRLSGWDYKMASAIKIKDVDSGSLKIQSSNSKSNGYHYASEFTFPNGYITKCTYVSGDTAISTYAILNGTKTLYEEKYTAIKSATEFRHRETSFSLTIGNVLIERQLAKGQSSLDSAKVYVSGVLQTKSKVEIVDVVTDATDQSVTHKKRELKITFDDGTSATFSELAGTVIDDISTLFSSMRSVNFATQIIDWIAWDIYTGK